MGTILETQDATSLMHDVKGIIFDYGGTLDSNGVHWSEVIWEGYRQAGLDSLITKEQFREAYVHAERELARTRHITPIDDFYTLMHKKIGIELQALRAAGHIHAADTPELNRHTAAGIAHFCDRRARECIEQARPVLEWLHARFPLMLVSNFYGNIDSVLRAYDIRHLFKGIIESAVVGVRKPNPTLFRMAIDALELAPQQVLVVGDSLNKDIEPAQSLGCHVLWLKGKGWTASEEALSHPCAITSITQVIDFFT